MNERIKELRKTLGLTLEKFGERLGVGKTAINKLEKGENNVTDQMFKSICREFNVNPEWLKDGTGDMFIAQTRNQEIVEFANRIMSDEDESFRKRFVTALSEARPEFWDELEVFLSTIKKD